MNISTYHSPNGVMGRESTSKDLKFSQAEEAFGRSCHLISRRTENSGIPGQMHKKKTFYGNLLTSEGNK